MGKRLISFVLSVLILGSITGVAAVDASVDRKEKCVDGSFLTTEDSSKGVSGSSMLKGKHMMDGECSITKAGLNRIYCYGATTANHVVDYLAVMVYVEVYVEDEDGDYWGRIDAWPAEEENTYYVSTSKTIKVDRGYYYRVRADHFVAKDPDPMEETFSVTNGILVP